MQGKKLFFKNAMVLTAASLFLRGLGMLFRVYISNVLGAEGMGLYQLIFSVYLLASTIASAGLTMAVTRIVAEQQLTLSRNQMRNMMLKLLVISAAIGAVTAAGLYIISPFAAEVWLKDIRSIPSLRILSISLPFMAVSASLRGYFMARRKITFTSVSQVAEQVVRFAACAVLLLVFGKSEMGIACFAVMASDTLSELASFFIQGAGFAADIKKLPSKTCESIKKPHTVKQFFKIALPVSGVRCVNSALYTIENILVPLRLTMFLGTRSQSLAQWGMLKGMALPLLMFPSGFMAGFIMLLVPEISENSVTGKISETKALAGRAIQYSMIASIITAGAFYLLANQLGVLIYNDTGIGFYMRVLAPLMPFIYLENVAESMLKGLDKQVSTLWFSLINSVVRIALIYLLVSMRGMKGFLFVMLVSNILTSYLHQHKLLCSINLKMQWLKWVIKPLLCVGVAYFVSHLAVMAMVNAGVSNLLQVLCAGVLMCVIYTVLIFVCGCLTKNDVAIFCRKTRKK